MGIQIKLKEVREKLDVSVNDLARSTGLSPQYIFRIESGKANPSLSVIEKISDALESIDWLLWQSSKKASEPKK